MEDEEPEIVSPDTWTAIPDPTELVANVPTAEAVFKVTVSPATTPTSVAPPTFKVAVVVASYVLLFAVMPVTVRFLRGNVRGRRRFREGIVGGLGARQGLAAHGDDDVVPDPWGGERADRVPVKETESLPTMPTRVPGVPRSVAVVEASYVLFEAVMPVTVRALAVIIWDMAVEVWP